MKKIMWIAAAVAALSVSSAKAEILTFNGTGMGQNISLSHPYGSGTYFVGQMNVTLDSAPAGMPTSFAAYCVDLQNTVSSGNSYPVDLIPLPDPGLMGVVNSGRAAWLYENFGGLVATNDQATALQLSIWDVLYDSGDGLGAGTFQATTNNAFVQAITMAFLGGSAGKSGNATWLRATEHPNNTRQNMIGPASAIPEPGAMSLLAVAGLPLLSGLRRRR